MQSTVGELRAQQQDASLGETVWLALRPEKLGLARERPVDGVNALAGTLVDVGYRGDHSVFNVRLADRSLARVLLPNRGPRTEFNAGDIVWMYWPHDTGVVLTR
jgi:putrescine transport system ATP-binding protein